jgi:hypothetical protein
MMDAFVTLAISLVLLATLMFGVILITFFTLVGVAFTLVVAGASRRAGAAPSVSPRRVVSPVLFPRRRSDWERERAA